MKFKVILFWPSCGQIGNKLLQYQNQINKMGRSVRRDVSITILGRCCSAECIHKPKGSITLIWFTRFACALSAKVESADPMCSFRLSSP